MQKVQRVLLVVLLSLPALGVAAPDCKGQAIFQLEGDGVRSERVRLWAAS